MPSIQGSSSPEVPSKSGEKVPSESETKAKSSIEQAASNVLAIAFNDLEVPELCSYERVSKAFEAPINQAWKIKARQMQILPPINSSGKEVQAAQAMPELSMEQIKARVISAYFKELNDSLLPFCLSSDQDHVAPNPRLSADEIKAFRSKASDEKHLYQLIKQFFLDSYYKRKMDAFNELFRACCDARKPVEDRLKILKGIISFYEFDGIKAAPSFTKAIFKELLDFDRHPHSDFEPAYDQDLHIRFKKAVKIIGKEIVKRVDAKDVFEECLSKAIISGKGRRLVIQTLFDCNFIKPDLNFLIKLWNKDNGWFFEKIPLILPFCNQGVRDQFLAAIPNLTYSEEGKRVGEGIDCHDARLEVQEVIEAWTKNPLPPIYGEEAPKS